MRRKIWGIVLTMCMLFSMVPMNVSAEVIPDPGAVVDDTIVSVESVTLDKTELTLEVEGTDVLVATVTPDEATDKTVTWTSSDEAVVTVDENGNVTAVAEGTAAITAKAGEVEAACEVTVVAKKTKEVDQPIEITEIKFTVDNLPKKAGDAVAMKDNLKYTFEKNKGYALEPAYCISYEGMGAPKEVVEGEKAKAGVVYVVGFNVKVEDGYELSDSVELTTNASAGAYFYPGEAPCIKFAHIISLDGVDISDIDVPFAGYQLDTDYTINPEMKFIDNNWFDITSYKDVLAAGNPTNIYSHTASGEVEEGNIYGFYGCVFTKLNSNAKVTFNGAKVDICSAEGFDEQQWFLENGTGEKEVYVAVYDDEYGELVIYAVFKTAKVKGLEKLDIKIDDPVLYGTPDREPEMTPNVTYKIEWKKIIKDTEGNLNPEDMSEAFATDTVYAACISSQTVLDENVKVYLDGAEVEIFKPNSNESYFSALKSLCELNADGTKKVAGAFVGPGYIEVWVFYEKFEDLVSGEDVKGYLATIDEPDKKDSLYEFNNWNEDYDSNTAYREDSSHKDIVITVKWSKDNKNKRPEKLPIQVFTLYDGQLVDFISGESNGIGYQFEQRKADTQWTYYFLQNTPQNMLSLRSVPVTEFEEGEAYFTFETPEGYTSSVEGNTITFTAIPEPEPEEPKYEAPIPEPKPEKPKKTSTPEVVEEPEVVEVVMVQTVPPTSDQSNVLGWNTLLAASALGFIVAFKYGRKRRIE